MSTTDQPNLAYRRVVALTGALFLSYLTVAMSLPAVPVHVVQGLGLDNAFGGLAVGIAFLSTILTRNYAGVRADRHGSKACMQRGLIVYAVAGLICLLASWPQLPVAGAYAVLILGRLLLGLGESLAMVGMISWAIGLMGQARSGQVISLVGAGMYGAFAAGGPLGLWLLHQLGFAGLMGVCTVVPLLGLVAIHRLPAVAPQAGRREKFWQIIGRIWRPGVAIVSLAVEAIGQYMLWLAPAPGLALMGALLTGLGCSMVFPAMGSEVVKQVPPHLRGTAIGGFAAFQDVAYGATGPLVGLLADYSGYAAVFLIGGLAATLGLWMAVQAHQRAVPARA